MRSVSCLTLAVVALSGCYQDHRIVGESDAPPIDGSAATPAPGALSRCVPPSSPTWVLGPERGCERKTVSLEAVASCEANPSWVLHGRPIRLVRTRPGRTDMRAYRDTPCGLHARPLRDLDCGRCDLGFVFEPDPLISGPDFPPFPDDGLIELLLAPVDATPCTTIDLEVCFDPDYGEPAWDG